MFLTYTIETDGRQADANQHTVLSHTIETNGFYLHNRNRWSHNSRATAFCHAWPILLFGFQDPLIPLLTYVSEALSPLLRLGTFSWIVTHNLYNVCMYMNEWCI